ncbi:MAG: methyltransferase [Candidatus Pacearchaeota archaeon]|nr:methyltransferase [Candidatus Pacearchaeota archaeon]
MIDAIGKIAILKFKEGISSKEKKKIALNLLKTQSNIKTVLEKAEKVKGRLRTIKTKYLAGEKTKETIYKESGCLFKLNTDSCYFSPRLSGERLEIASKIKKGKVLVLFAGVGPFSIIIAKKNPQVKVTSVELGKECCKYAKENVILNRLNNIRVIPGDVKKVLPKLKEKFDYIVMPRPQLKDTFLEDALKVSKKNTIIFYYDFSSNPEEILEKIKNKRLKVLSIKKAGNIAPYKYRWRLDLKVI